MNELAYKLELEETLSRLRALHGRQAQDRIFASFSIPGPTLDRFARQHAEGFCDAPEPRQRARFWDDLLAERRELRDDSIPCAYLSELDQGLYGGLVGGEVQYMCHPDNGWISSMVTPLLTDWSGLDGLRFDRHGAAFQRYLAQLRAFVGEARGRFGVSHFILIDSLNFAFELVGATRTYASLLDEPEVVRRAVDLAFDINVAVQEAFFEEVPLLAGGTCSNMVQWMPGRIVSESVDPFHMTSVDYFEAWGREPVERILARFDGGVVHLHGNGRHQLEAIASVRGLRAVYLGEDRGFPPAVEVLADLRRRAGDLPLVVSVELGTFSDLLGRHGLEGGVLYQVSATPDVDAANRCMDRVRAYRV